MRRLKAVSLGLLLATTGGLVGEVFLSHPALAQVAVTAGSSTPGANDHAGQDMTAASLTCSSATNALVVASGSKLCLDGSSCTRYLSYTGGAYTWATAGVSGASFTSTAGSGSDGVILGAGALVRTDQVRSTGSTTLTLKGNPADGSSAVGVLVDTGTTLVNGTAKVFTVRSGGGGDLFYVETNGFIHITGIDFSAGNRLTGNVSDGASAVGTTLDNQTQLSTVGAKTLSIKTGGVERAFFDRNGALRVTKGTPSQPSCDSTIRGLLWFTESANGVADKMEVCSKDAADSYAWRTLL